MSDSDIEKKETLQGSKTEISKRLLLIFSVFLLSFAVLTHPSLPKIAVMDALAFCLKTLIPSLFPFMVAGELLIYAGFPKLCERHLGKAFQKIFGISGRGAAAFVIGAFCGFPVGGKAAVSLYLSGDIEKGEAEKLAGICNNCGIGFLISGIGAGLWGSIFFGIILYLSQLFAGALTGFFLFGIKKQRSVQPPSVTYNQKKNHKDTFSPNSSPSRIASNTPQADFSLSGAISNAVSSSVPAILKVVGFVVFFEIVLSIVGVLLAQIGASPLLTSLVFSLTEITSGTKALFSLSCLSSPILTAIAKILTFTFSAFGGLSVYMQLCAIAIPEGIRTGAYIKTKLVQSVICTAFGAAFVLLGVI